VILEALAAVIGFLQPMALDHGTHGAVEDEQALGEQGGKFGGTVGLHLDHLGKAELHRGRRKNKRRHKPVSGLRAPLIIAEPGPVSGSQRSSAEALVYWSPCGLPSALIYLAFHRDPAGGLADRAAGQVEMHHEITFFTGQHPFDPPFPDFFAQIVEDDLAGRHPE